MRKLAVLGVFSALLASPPAHAQGRGLKFEGDVVKGRIQKPEVAFLVTKQNLTPKYELDLRESFLPKVVDSVEKKPF